MAVAGGSISAHHEAGGQGSECVLLIQGSEKLREQNLSHYPNLIDIHHNVSQFAEQIMENVSVSLTIYTGDKVLMKRYKVVKSMVLFNLYLHNNAKIERMGN